ncbi:hypothetical protein CK203_092419 [Vitis vinifera]|uniref:Retrovirus-related Pol polyprotein from transposon TNT 1-94 n=1 Tax=Vitis vinifera TaxID=29760 RepID=A0A438DY61_VITVI|nr:hypothetical protein CK203_092419 [Vitis vinifera]
MSTVLPVRRGTVYQRASAVGGVRVGGGKIRSWSVRRSAGKRGSIEQHENVRELLKAIDEQFITSDKALASTLIMKFTSLKLIGIKRVREHIMEMRDIVAQLKKLEVEMSESFLMHFILNTLSPQYGPFKISYNTHKDKWSINELMTMCVQEEIMLMMDQGESTMLVTQKKGKKRKSQVS